MNKIKKVLVLLLLVIVSAFCVAGCNSGTDELQSKIDGLQNQLSEMNSKLSEMEELKNELSEMNDRLSEMEEQIEQLEKELQDSGDKMQNYVLKISADKQVYRSEEDILIDITLENRGGTDIDIAYYSPLAVPDSSTGQFPAIEQYPEVTKRIFENGESIHLTDRLNGCFSVGQHSLKYRAVFYLGWETTDSVVEISSNTIDISIII